MSAIPFPAPASSDDKNSIYDTVGDVAWQIAVYEAVHSGWEFTNIAGAPLLDAVAGAVGLTADSHVVELCSGTGAVALYLNRHHACAVTGIELNPHQLLHARRARSAAGPAATRVSFVQGDVVSWQPDRLYDLALVIDSLSLLSDPVAALRNSRRALWSGAWLAFADTVEGPSMTAATAARVWDLDGIRPLPGPAGITEMMHAAGLVDVQLTDSTDTAMLCFATIARTLRAHAATLAELIGDKGLAQWRESTDFYLDAYASGQLSYRHGVARRPKRVGGTTATTPSEGTKS